MTRLLTAKLLKISFSVSVCLLAGCTDEQIAEFLAEPTPPAVDNTIGTLAETSRAGSSVVRYFRTGDGTDIDLLAERLIGRYNFGAQTASAEGISSRSLSTSRDYVAIVNTPGDDFAVIAMLPENVPSTGTATFQGIANYRTSGSDVVSRISENGAAALLNVNFNSGDVDVRVTGEDATIAVDNLEMFGTTGSYRDVSASFGTISITGGPSKSDLMVEGEGSFAGPNSEETAGVFDLGGAYVDPDTGEDKILFATFEIIAGR